MKTLIFNIPCTLLGRHYNSILGSMVRNLVRKQPHTTRKTHIMIALAALAEGLCQLFIKVETMTVSTQIE